MYRELLLRLPTNLISRAMGVVSERAFPAQGVINRLFARFAGINLEESEASPESYPTLNAFFTRRLKPGVHVVAEGEGLMVSPVDGRLAQFGRIDDGVLIQAKGRSYQVGDLLGSAEDGRHFSTGFYATLYLSPKDYHRIHSPVAGEVEAMSYLPGRLLPVNDFAVTSYDDLFPRNERLISHVKDDEGHRIAVVKVGATCVGRISVVYDDFVSNLRGDVTAFHQELDPAVPVSRGGELGQFNLGSTVVLVFDGPFEFDPDLTSGQGVRMGQRLGKWT